MNSLTQSGVFCLTTAGFLPHCQRQHSRKEDCSKHLTLGSLQGKSCATLKETRPHEILAFSRAGRGRDKTTWANSQAGAEKSATQSFHSRAGSASSLGSRVAPQLLTQRSCVFQGGHFSDHREGSALIPLHPMTSSRLSTITIDFRRTCPSHADGRRRAASHPLLEEEVEDRAVAHRLL